jgi:hypothetical protein
MSLFSPIDNNCIILKAGAGETFALVGSMLAAAWDNHFIA